VAIVDYGMGNLFSVDQACKKAGLSAFVTSSPEEVAESQGAILPGVGSFPDAMEALDRLGLTSVLKDLAASGAPLAGICLGMQLLMTESHEFGLHKGLDFFKGEVVPFLPTSTNGRTLKVPQVGWNQIYDKGQGSLQWEDSPLAGLESGEYMYFVHSYYIRPEDETVVLSTSTYGDTEFCSSLIQGNIFGCQFHPERSGAVGISVYRELAAMVDSTVIGQPLG
jgi:glutamine amidotransferase